MKDYYQILGIERAATADDVKRAYRRLASQHHPDKGGDKSRFQEIQEAYDVLGNSQRRQQYDQPSYGFAPEGFAFQDVFDIFRQQAMAQGRTRVTRMQLWIGYRDLLDPAPKTVSVATPQGQANIELTVPGHIEDGESVRYPRLAPGGHDLVVQFRIRPDEDWRHDARNLIAEFEFTIWDLILGSSVTMTTPEGITMDVRVPAGTQPGSSLRVRGHGLHDRRGGRGDLMIKIAARIPDQISPELMQHIQHEAQR